MKNPFNIYKYLPLITRRKFNENYIIIESDDWGMDQSHSYEGIEYLKSQYGKDKFTRWTTDALETDEDIELLFDILRDYKSDFEYPPVITTNFITHNIDYNNQQLSFIPMSKKFNNNSSKLYHEGISNRLIYPQLHGYSHYNIKKLGEFLNCKEGKKLFKYGFLNGLSTLRGKTDIFHSELTDSISTIQKNLQAALNEFNNFFGFQPSTFIPPHFLINLDLLGFFRTKQLKGIQASNRLIDIRGKRVRKSFFIKTNGIIWMPRNARLDPHPDYNFFSKECIAQIKNAFKLKMPAIIDFHRVNIAGKYNKKYRDIALNELRNVFSSIKIFCPEAKFITTAEFIKICQATTK